MDIATKINDELNQWLSDNKSILDDANTESISVKTFETRENIISQLSNFLASIPTIASKIEAALARAKNTHAKEISTVDSLLSKTEASWTTVVRRQQPKPRAKISQPSYQAINRYDFSVLNDVDNKSDNKSDLIKNDNKTDNKNDLIKTESIKSESIESDSIKTVPQYSSIKFTEALSLPAIRVPTFEYVKQDGELYYVESSDHFAFILAGKLLHGNIGVIYTEEKNPEKIKDCKFAASCMKQDKCDYYHDPVKFKGSHDHRNFIASSWLYAPPNSQYKSRPRSRRFGSREYLDTDIVGLQEEEISRFYDQTMHDLLCSLLLSHSYRMS